MCLQSLAPRLAQSVLRWTVKQNNKQTDKKHPWLFSVVISDLLIKSLCFQRFLLDFLSNFSCLWPRGLLRREVQNPCNHPGAVREEKGSPRRDPEARTQEACRGRTRSRGVTQPEAWPALGLLSFCFAPFASEILS